MVPIGILTHNRHGLLDVTLRSLSASGLSDDQPLVVFDDGSDNEHTLRYLYSNDTVSTHVNFPLGDPKWQHYMEGVKSRPTAAGIKDKVQVARINKYSLGVVNAGCIAIRHLVSAFGRERGVVLLQDDVVFTENWLQKMLDAVAQIPKDEPRAGLVTGCWVLTPNANKTKPISLAERGGTTAQCYYITEAGLASAWYWITQQHTIRKQFDNKLVAAVRLGSSIYRMHPPICQHVGIDSKVRPEWKWKRWNSKGRIDFYMRGPYAMADEVRTFKGALCSQ